ncbi:hypothetical protein RIF29_24183 [Crotalaria pallida]|uniref:Uncharacterized protein n=1 Tax=Crotalaria pallida TaxID=3830 RepID=A0AAN9EJA9_CROPI
MTFMDVGMHVCGELHRLNDPKTQEASKLIDYLSTTKMSLKGQMRIPNVQEMVKRDPERVPEIYIRNNIDMGDAKRVDHLSSQIPIIDLAMLKSGSNEELLKLDMACKDWGFFQG